MYLKHLNKILHEGEEDKSDDTYNLILKIVSIVVFLAMAMGFGVMPHFIKKCRTSTKFLGIANAFSGGLFLGIGLFHVLPESAEMLESLSEMPVAYFCAFLSYALILFVEKVAFNSHALLHGHDHEDKNNESNRITLSKLNESESREEKQEPMIKIKEPEPIKSETEKDGQDEEKDHDENDHDHDHDHEHEHHKKGSSITSYVLLLALGFHGLFEGMALGIQSDVQSTFSLFLAIAAHKWAASLTLGISFVKAGVSRTQLIIMVCIFAFIGPVGIAFGLILTTTASEVVEGIFLAISVGTFIYISCSEVLVEEFENPDNKFIKFCMFMLGGIFIAGLALWEVFGGVEE